MNNYSSYYYFNKNKVPRSKCFKSAILKVWSHWLGKDFGCLDRMPHQINQISS